MNKITNFQLYCMMLILVGPIAYLEQPHVLVHSLHNDAWLGAIISIFPGLIIIYIFSGIIKRSSRHFPLLLVEHLGKALGSAIGFLYIPVFILAAAYTLRLFIEFMKMNVLPATPISIFIAVLLALGYYAIKSGLQAIARISELFVLAGLPLGIIIIIISIFSGFNFDRMLPLGHSDLRSWAAGTAGTATVLGKMMPALSLAFFLPDKMKAGTVMRQALYTLVPLIALTSFGVVVSLGSAPALKFTYPTFSMIRLARIGAFIQNIDIIFVGILIAGIAGAVIIPWFMACLTAREIFGLRDYRYIAAPCTLIIGVLAVVISGNNLGVVLWSIIITPVLNGFFFFILPLIVFIITLFKPHAGQSAPPSRPRDGMQPE